MTHEDKIQKCMSGFNQTKEEAEENVFFLNWVTEEQEALNNIHKGLSEITKIPFIEMCLNLWNDESNGIKRANYFIN